MKPSVSGSHRPVASTNKDRDCVLDPLVAFHQSSLDDGEQSVEERPIAMLVCPSE
jgi:hypothetical protein